MKRRSILLSVMVFTILLIPGGSVTGTNYPTEVNNQSQSVSLVVPDSSTDLLQEQTFEVAEDGYPTVDGEPLFTLNIVVSTEGNEIPLLRAEYVRDALRDIGIEGVIWDLPYYDMMDILYSGYQGQPTLVNLGARIPHFHHQVYDGRGVMWCGADDPDWATPPGYGNEWIDYLTKKFTFDPAPQGDFYRLKWTWQYDTEPEYDFVYVEYSTDDGESWTTVARFDDNSYGWVDEEFDLIDVPITETEFQIRFRFESDIYYSDADGWYESDGACRIDEFSVISVSGGKETTIAEDHFETGNDEWAATAPDYQKWLGGFDLAILAHSREYGYDDPYGYDPNGKNMGTSDYIINHGYSNPEYDALSEELDSLNINWYANFPDPPDLSSPAGIRALEILYEMQDIYVQDQPVFVMWSRIHPQMNAGFPITVPNHRNEYLSSPQVRRAISLALPRQEMMENTGYEGSELAVVQTWLPPRHPGFDPAFLPVYNLGKAKHELFKAGYPVTGEHYPIYIDENADFKALGFPGEGTEEDPYRIENYWFTGNTDLIHIQDTTAWFEISGCYLDGDDKTHNGITLINVINGNVSNNIIENCYSGIYVEWSTEITVEDNLCNGNWFGIYLLNSHGNDIISNTCKENDFCGIFLYNSHDCDITGNTCNGNGEDGILLRVSRNNEVTENICEHNGYAGIYLDQANGNNANRNTCNYNTIHGIHVLWSGWLESNTITNNSCSGSDHYGIRVEFSNNNIVVNNTCTSNTIVGIELSDSYYNTVANNTCTNQNLGINILDSKHNEILENTCNDDYGINLLSSFLNIVTDNDCSGSIIGISIGDSKNNQVIGNDCSECEEYGIILDTCTSSVLINNTCNENENGIWLIFSDEIDVIENTCSGNSVHGIQLEASTLNSVSDNTCDGNGGFGIYLRDSHSNTISGNICPENLVGIYLYRSTDNDVIENTCDNNSHTGIYLYVSDNNNIVGNSFNNNVRRGITLSSSDDNEVVGNICFNNENGFYLIESSSNIIFHNSIINNVIQATDTDSQGGNFWYNQDIQEGNYWSDYVGVDSNNDGIGDTHVPWPDTGFDLYPLMIPTALQESIEVIESKIQDFVDSGILNENDVNPLTTKLDAAIGFIDKGKPFQASQKLGDFISQVNALVNSGRLSVADGEYLISLAQGIIDVLLTM